MKALLVLVFGLCFSFASFSAVTEDQALEKLAGGSDEQEMTIVLRFVPIQDSGISIKLLDAVYLENDGPNELSFSQRLNQLKVEKKVGDRWQKL